MDISIAEGNTGKEETDLLVLSPRPSYYGLNPGRRPVGKDQPGYKRVRPAN